MPADFSLSQFGEIARLSFYWLIENYRDKAYLSCALELSQGASFPDKCGLWGHKVALLPFLSPALLHEPVDKLTGLFPPGHM